MIKIKGPKFQRNAWRKIKAYLRKEFNAAWYASIKAFIDATSSKIKIDTGMSIASLRPLAGVVRHRVGLEAARPTSGAVPWNKQKGKTKSLDYYWGSGGKGKGAGETLGKTAFKVERMKENKMTMIFEYRVNVGQWALHEGKDTKYSQNWQSLAAGKAAFHKEWDVQMEKRISTNKLNQLLESVGLR